MDTTLTFPIGTHVRGHQFRSGTVTGHDPRSGMPIVQLDGETHGFAIHPAQLMTETHHQAIIAAATTPGR